MLGLVLFEFHFAAAWGSSRSSDVFRSNDVRVGLHLTHMLFCDNLLSLAQGDYHGRTIKRPTGLKQDAVLGALLVRAGRESFHSGLIGGCRLIDRARNDATKVGGRKVSQTKDINERRT